MVILMSTVCCLMRKMFSHWLLLHFYTQQWTNISRSNSYIIKFLLPARHISIRHILGVVHWDLNSEKHVGLIQTGANSALALPFSNSTLTFPTMAPHNSSGPPPTADSVVVGTVFKCPVHCNNDRMMHQKASVNFF